MSQRSPNTISRNNAPNHGSVFTPASRPWFAWEEGKLDEGARDQRECGKFFPEILGGLLDSDAKDDVANSPPPPDGKIASANQLTGAFLDEPGDHWKKHEVRSGEALDISWYKSAKHATRCWNYFITKVGWDPEKVLSRDQFEPKPFFTVRNNLQPYWAHEDALEPTSPTTHGVPLPKRSGYHVMLAVWEIANTSMGFYNVLDLLFAPEDGGDRPDRPTGLKASDVTDKQVVLTWNKATGPNPIKSYQVTRNGITVADIDASLQTLTDNSVEAQTLYHYAVIALDEQDNASDPSPRIQVHTLPEGGEDAPPTAPANLHSMGQTARTVSLMWGKSIGWAPIEKYLIYRDDQQVNAVSGDKTSADDTGLTPETKYRYFVRALDLTGKLSPSSNILDVKTKAESKYPAWELGAEYRVGDWVSHVGKNWSCKQKHIAHVPDWAPDKAKDVLWDEQP